MAGRTAVEPPVIRATRYPRRLEEGESKFSLIVVPDTAKEHFLVVPLFELGDVFIQHDTHFDLYGGGEIIGRGTLLEAQEAPEGDVRLRFEQAGVHGRREGET